MKRKKTNKLRIIAGKWRSRQIDFPAIEGLRPTTDRTRETLFNWLNPYIIESQCLDLFAGSGVLGFEALSRGAKHVTFVDAHPVVCQQLRNTSTVLQCEGDVDIIRAEANIALTQLSQAYDIIFIDPPFEGQSFDVSLLAQHGLLKKPALVYIETHKQAVFKPLAGWEPLKQATTRQVCASLYSVT